MFFKLLYIARDTHLDGHVLKISDPISGIDLTLRECTKEEAGAKYVAGDGICEAICEREVPERLEEEARASGHVSIKSDLVAKVDREMSELIGRALRVVRWRQGSPGAPDPIRYYHSLAWSFDKASWKQVLDTIHLNLHLGTPFTKWSDELGKSVEQIVADGKSEPLAHELFREASVHEAQNPRSAVILAVAAAEIGFKRFAAQLIPKARWLIDNLQSPPLVKMLDEYLPLLPVRLTIEGKPPFVPKSIRDELKKAVLLRNELVHGRLEVVKPATVKSILQATRDLLYLLDVYGGLEWAADNISIETRKELSKS